MTVAVAVHGAAGRMGRAVMAVVDDEQDLSLVAAVERQGGEAVGADVGVLLGGEARGLAVTTDVASAVAVADVVIDFTTPGATAALLQECAQAGKPAVVGTTGLDEAAERAIEAAAEHVPLVVAPNFSQGVTLLFHLAERAAELLGPSFDAEIVEMHHARKVDAPSGTAVALARAVLRAKGLSEDDVVHGRSGHVGARRAREVGVMALRGGDVVGEHTLVLAGPGERLELIHRATDRGIFARGAVRAARWVLTRPPGRHDMAAVMGL